MRRNDQMSPMRMLVMLAVLWAAGTWLFAAESTPPTPAKPEPAKATPVPAQAAGTGAPTTEEAEAALATANSGNADDEEQPAEQSAQPEQDDKQGENAKQASAADKGGTPQRFVPSEQVRADFDVSFPIDI